MLNIQNCTIFSNHKESNILKYRKQTALTITNCYAQNIGFSNGLPIARAYFLVSLD